MTTSPDPHVDPNQSNAENDLASRLVNMNVNQNDNTYNPPQSPNPYTETPRSQAPYSPLPYGGDEVTQYYLTGLGSPFQAPNILPGTYPYGRPPPDLVNMNDGNNGLNINGNGTGHGNQNHTFSSISDVYGQSRADSQPHTPTHQGYTTQRHSVHGGYRPQGDVSNRQIQGYQQEQAASYYGYGDTRYFIGGQGYNGNVDKRKDNVNRCHCPQILYLTQSREHIFNESLKTSHTLGLTNQHHLHSPRQTF